MSPDDEPQRSGSAATDATTTSAPADPPRLPATGPGHAVRPIAVRGVLLSLAVAMSFVGFDLAYRLGGGPADAPTSRMKMDEDGSYAEIVAWVAMVLAAVLLAQRALALPRAPVLGVWAAMLLVVTADDALMIHETAGGAVARGLGWTRAFGLDAQGWGELAVWAGIGAVVGTALLLTFLRSGRLARRTSGYLLACVGVLGVGAVGVDMIAVVAEPYVDGTLSWVIAAVESGVELLAAGLFLTVAACLLVAAPRGRTS